MTNLHVDLQQSLGATYVIDRELSGGAMSRVFAATDIALNRRVVLKVLPPDVGEGVSLERFRREVHLAATLQHPHIVPVLSAGEVIGLPYYVMPFVEGESLRARLAHGALPLADAIGVLWDVAKALAYAHEHLVVHRDIKPENILLSGGSATVADFGIAKAINAARPARLDATLTREGTSLGTPAYMAPEQAVADPSADHRVDIYSFGCVAYEALVGRPPFTHQAVQGLLAAHLTETPQPIAELRPDVPGDLADIMMRCLEKDAAARPQSAAELVQYFESLATHGTSLRADRPGKRDYWSTKHRVSAVTALAVVCAAGWATIHALGVGPFGTASRASILSKHERLLVADLNVSGADTTLGRVLSEALRAELSQSTVISVVPLSAVGNALRLMKRPPTSALNESLAREVAEREAAKAIVSGDLTPLGTGYIVTLRLSAADSGDLLTSVHATARTATDLIPVLDNLTKQLRRATGESLRHVRATPPLERVTTGSLDALRKYARAVYALDVEVDYAKAIPLLKEAIAEDTSFGMAYRKLAAAYNNGGYPLELRRGAARAAYRLCQRLTERECLLAEAYYMTLEVNRGAAASAYERILHIDSLDLGSLINLGLVFYERRQFARAETLWRLASGIEAAPVIALDNVRFALLNQGKLREADSVTALMRARFPSRVVIADEAMSQYLRGHIDSAVLSLERQRAQAPVVPRAWATGELGALAQLRGRLGLAERLFLEERKLDSSRGLPSGWVDDSITAARLDLFSRHQSARAAARLEATFQRMPVRVMPPSNRPYMDVAQLHAMAGRPDRSRALLAQYDAETTDSALIRRNRRQRDVVLGEIALAEHQPREALKLFARSDFYDDGPSDPCGICTDMRLARAFDQANEPDSAIVYYERFVTTPYALRIREDAQYLPRAYRRLGALYEFRGDRTTAANYYARFIDLWDHADPELQRQVAEVRGRLARLSEVIAPATARAITRATNVGRR